jgi:hypothetical protein
MAVDEGRGVVGQAEITSGNVHDLLPAVGDSIDSPDSSNVVFCS